MEARWRAARRAATVQRCRARAGRAAPDPRSHRPRSTRPQLRTRALAATCANCHGTDGRAVSESAVPGLAGMPASYLVEQMKAFRSGARPATVMHQLAKGYSDAQIEQIAAYFAARPH
ncbi:c-type cytochrome [Piscinibacter sakaiensis]|uniref:c-type cytochrome n=1 Tax=Piscinibacter sakaiensis TaxID=1547922 RepID=UPI003729E6FE